MREPLGGTVFVTEDGAIVYSLPEGRGRDVPDGASQQVNAEGVQRARDAEERGRKVVSGRHGQAPLAHADAKFVAANTHSPLLRIDNANCPIGSCSCKCTLIRIPTRSCKERPAGRLYLPSNQVFCLPITIRIPHSKIRNPHCGALPIKNNWWAAI